MIFVDSSVWIDYINNADTSQTSLLDSILGNESIVVGDRLAGAHSLDASHWRSNPRVASVIAPCDAPLR